MSAVLFGWWEKSYAATRERVLLHIFFWIGYLSFFGAAAYQHFAAGDGQRISPALLLWATPLYLVPLYYFFIGTTYVQAQKKQFVKVAISGLAALLLYVHASAVFFYLQAQQMAAAGIPSKYGDLGGFSSFYKKEVLSTVAMVHAAFWFLLYMFVPVGCKVFRDMQRSARKLSELKDRNIQLELNLIKSQVSPHFLLNTLNNIYGITINGTRQQIGDMILNLSDFLKYSLYDCNQEFVPLSKEIKLIQNFMQLEAIRSEFIHTDFDVKVDEGSYSIPPFILFPLVENAFKHGTHQAIKSTSIRIGLSAVNRRLLFTVENEIQTNGAEKGGIGLTALKKKIDYYYPGRSSFSSKVADNRYIAELQIDGL